ncbi:MAG: hypothetical protein AAF431_11240 [Pseudomonadota bacterium]
MINKIFPLRTILAIAALVSLSFSSLVLASGTSGGGSGSYTYSAPRQVDQNYEYGKSIYQGRKAGSAKLAYCLDIEGEKVPAKRKSFKKFKRATYTEFANALYNCDQPESQVRNEIDSEDFKYVLYYLNKRFNLALK